MKANQQPKVTEPARDIAGRVLYEEPGLDRDWYSLSEERREPWREDADRVIAALGKTQNGNHNSVHERLKAACTGTPAKISWPHRLLHDAADEIARLEAMLAKAKEAAA